MLLFAFGSAVGCGPRLRVLPSDEVQLLLIQQAQAHYAEGRYEAAARILRRMIDTYPHSPKIAEARWWLARSYEQAGEFKGALAEYRLLAAMPPTERARPASYGPEAKQRIASLEQRLGLLAATTRGLVAIQVPSRDVPDGTEADQWVRALSQAGITMIVLDAGTKPGSARAPLQVGVHFRTNWAPVLRDVFGTLVPVAHRHGVAVFAAVTLRRMNWLDGRLGWNDVEIDRTTAGESSSSELDLFNPSFQEYLVGLLADLAATGIDGILFRADAPSGPREGFSPHALRGFERDFGVKLDPVSVVPREEMAASGTRFAQLKDGRPVQQHASPDYWRWLGWKARETVKILARLRQAVRTHSPVLQFALELHQEAVSDPIVALVRYGEDLLEAKADRFDWYITAPGPPPAPYIIVPPPNGVPTTVRPTGTFLDRAVELIGEAERIVVAKPLTPGDSTRPWTVVAPAADRATLASGIGLMYMGQPLPVP